MRKIMSALAFVALAWCVMATSASAQVATSQGQFCGVWERVCHRVCTEGAASCSTKCAQRKNACISNGCFDLWSRNRCWGNKEDVALTDPRTAPGRGGGQTCRNTASNCTGARAQCVQLGGGAQCAPTFSACMQDGSWKTSQCNRTGLARQ